MIKPLIDWLKGVTRAGKEIKASDDEKDPTSQRQEPQQEGSASRDDQSAAEVR